MGKFKCGQCGVCCKATFVSAGENVLGLYLDPSEIGFFKPEQVFPLFGHGDPIQVTAYQLGVDRCPNYDEVEGLGRCGIYADRPLVCASFPAISSAKVSGRCTAVKAAFDGVDRDSLQPELEALRKKLDQEVAKPPTQYVWPLNKKMWIPIERSK